MISHHRVHGVESIVDEYIFFYYIFSLHRECTLGLLKKGDAVFTLIIWKPLDFGLQVGSVFFNQAPSLNAA